jgi:hypothetical protein
MIRRLFQDDSGTTQQIGGKKNQRQNQQGVLPNKELKVPPKLWHQE